MTMPTPDRDLDAEVAEKVMGWKQDAPGSIWWHDGKQLREVPDYGTDIAAAMQVVEKLLPEWNVVLTRHIFGDGLKWQVTIYETDEDGYVVRELVIGPDERSAPLAICRAALAAVESDASPPAEQGQTDD